MAEVIWTEPALDDLEEVAGFIALDKPSAAARLVKKVMAQVGVLATFPGSGGKPAELRGTPYRHLVVPPVRIFYRVTDEHVFIVYVMRSERRFRLREVAERER